MCGAYGFSSFGGSVNVWLRYELDNKPEVRESFNIRPSLPALVVTRNSPNKGEIKSFGIKAPWDDKKLLINAKSETVAELRTFAKMFRESRCLIPATYFFEWQRTKEGKQPYAFSLKDNEPFSFAGLYRDDGFVILTTKPNTLMEDVHNRMPVILSREDEDLYLNPDTEEAHLLEMLEPYPVDEMRRWAVSSLVNRPSNNGPEVLKEVTPLTS